MTRQEKSVLRLLLGFLVVLGYPVLVILGFSVLIILVYPASGDAGIAKTKHNLSVTGPGEIKALSETEICVFCHTPHNAEPKTPLWGHVMSDVKNYKIYSSPSMKGKPLQPDGASKLCLSCHDGTVALGAVRTRNKPIAMRGKVDKMPPAAKGYIGTDLSGSHPISFTVRHEDLQQRNIKIWELTGMKPLEAMKSDPDGVKLDVNDKVQCTSCHDAHRDDHYDTSGVRFYRKPSWSGTCEVCHDP